MQEKHLSNSELSDWAIEKVDDVIFGCILNARLRSAGLCQKFLFEMTEEDLDDYYQVVIDIHDRGQGI